MSMIDQHLKSSNVNIQRRSDSSSDEETCDDEECSLSDETTCEENEEDPSFISDEEKRHKIVTTAKSPTGFNVYLSTKNKELVTESP